MKSLISHSTLVTRSYMPRSVQNAAPTGVLPRSLARKGPTEPFYYYDPYETNPRFAHDPTGASPYGRYTVRFASAWEQSVSFARADVEIELIEIACCPITLATLSCQRSNLPASPLWSRTTRTATRRNRTWQFNSSAVPTLILFLTTSSHVVGNYVYHRRRGPC